MSFLEPMLLAALPLAALPVIIHLINQRRYQTIRWGAMMFVLQANRMSRGYARLRQILIMLFRILAIATLVFAVSRPLAGGWLGLAAGGRPDVTMVLVDRSPSMQETAQGMPGGKLETALARLVPTLETLGSDRFVLIESTANAARPLENPRELLRSPDLGPASASADLPGMLQTAYDYIKANKVGRTEIWIVSDLRENDWNAESGRWRALHDGFADLTQGVRFHLLAYPDSDAENLRLRVTGVRRRKAGDGIELLVSLRIEREGRQDAKESIPVQFEIDGARSEATVELVGSAADLKDHPIPLEKGRERGWGRVSIPADANPADNDYWFTFEPPVPRKTIVVAEDPAAARPIALAASIPPDPALKCEVETTTPAQAAAADWDAAALLVWSAPLPQGDAARAVESFLSRGGSALFLPTAGAGDASFLGLKYGAWSGAKGETAIESWRGDEDLLAASQSGLALPVGALAVRRYQTLIGDATPLAILKGGAPLLSRATTPAGSTYFLTTTAAAGDSSLASNGVVLYVMVQRALAQGAQALGGVRQVTAGESSRGDGVLWTRVSGAKDAISTDYRNHAGVYAAQDRLLAVNRSAAEDAARVIPAPRLAELFRGLDFSRVDERAGRLGSLIQEIWRMFLVAMITAMAAEALLCLPKLAPVRGAATS